MASLSGLSYYEAVIERDLDLKIIKGVKTTVPSDSFISAVIGKLADITGLLVCCYLIFLGLTLMVTRGKMENYLVQELI